MSQVEANEGKPGTLSDRVEELSKSVQTLAGSRVVLGLNLLALTALVTLTWLAEKSVLTAWLLFAWSAVACVLAHRAGGAQRLCGKKVAVAYGVSTALLFVLLQGVYQLFSR